MVWLSTLLIIYTKASVPWISHNFPLINRYENYTDFNLSILTDQLTHCSCHNTKFTFCSVLMFYFHFFYVEDRFILLSVFQTCDMYFTSWTHNNEEMNLTLANKNGFDLSPFEVSQFYVYYTYFFLLHTTFSLPCLS